MNNFRDQVCFKINLKINFFGKQKTLVTNVSNQFRDKFIIKTILITN